MSRITIALPLAAAALLATSAPALAADRDHDGMNDRWERRHNVTRARFDADRDGISNVGEFRFKTDPRRADTDRDGLRDGDEQRLGTDPRDRDTDDDGIRDGRERTGAVAAFADGVLTITFANGTAVTALLDEETEVECATAKEYAGEDDAPTAVASSQGRGRGDDDEDDDAERVDNSGRGNAEDRPAAPVADDDRSAADTASDVAGDDETELDLGGCTPDQLDGALVREAELELTVEGWVLDELELVVKG